MTPIRISKIALFCSLIRLCIILNADEPQYCLSGGGDNTLRYWRISNGECIRTFIGHSNWIHAVAISPDGQYALSGSYKVVKYWRIADGQCLMTFNGHEDWINSVTFSPDGRYALSGCDDWTMKYWDTLDGSCIRTFTGHIFWIHAVDISTDGLYALSGSDDWTLKYWNISDGTCIRTFTGHTYRVASSVFSYDGLYALSGSQDSTIKYWKISDGSCIRTITGHIDQVLGVDISLDGQYALSGSRDNTLKYWKISDGSCIRTLTGHTAAVNSVAISSDGNYALSGSSDTTLKYWSITSGVCLNTFAGHYGAIRSLAISPLYLSVIKPNGDEKWKVGSIQEIKWTNTGEDTLTLYYSTNNGSEWILIDKTPCYPNSYYWNIPDTPSEECLVKITTKTGIPTDVSDKVFTIYRSTGFRDKSYEYKPLPVSFSASPNPFSLRLFLSMPHSGAVYSLTGQVIIRVSQGKQIIDTKDWKAGIYIIKCGKETKRVVKLN